MKKVYIIHGWGGNPEEPMHIWLKDNLKKKGFEMIVPEMPNSEKPKINDWVNKLKNICKNPNKDTYFIGHSVGCQGILRYLETINNNVKIGGVVFIAPWITLNEEAIKEEGEESVKISKPWIETPINWNKVKSHSDKFFCIFSDNDPYVPLTNKKLFEKNLGAETILEHNKGHFTEESGVKENKTVLAKLLEMAR
jgi:predicted alpha/beta hydrolase family esterase